ncbi:LacI family DNA-binding transcriptional regulator [Actinocatenispora rupis]|uniref:LacI family transcriptional regulator n=1 Tax=Actinocatenispora rupis TaxID=519421 RepID=A0A8J3J174_9ACTN|nr:LacI family DNA-binding transcriptional regulator [Actinocatenispora rupis]GID12338.1 LacI family transcriptional regulator [Actinocatenispora rupis]
MDRPRLKDVAERAGVSLKTASNVVNDFPHVSDATRQRVQEAIDALGYRPNVSARNLARGRTGIIALAVPRLDMPYVAEMARYVIEAADAHSWIVLVEQTAGRPEWQNGAVLDDLFRRIDGLIYSPGLAGESSLEQVAADTPIVLLGENLYDERFDHVSIDNVAAARTATEHLVAVGKRRIAAVGVRRERQSGTTRERLTGYRQALRAAGLPVEPKLVRPAGSFRGEEGERAAEALLRLPKPPDGIFCFTDWVALGVLRALHNHGVRVPEDIAVVGFDDIPYGRVATPSITTIAPDKREIARIAVDLLAQRLSARGRPSPRSTLVDFDLVVRESTSGRTVDPGGTARRPRH